MMGWNTDGGLSSTVQGMEFIAWLQEQHPELDISANVPTEALHKLVADFCVANKYPDAPDFTNQLLAWLSGNGDPQIVAKLQEMGITVKTSNQNSRPEVSPFARYSAVPYHGIFLFLVASDFPGFVQTYWEDLNALTGDLLDVYYSGEDLERRVSAYDVLDKFRSLNVARTALPCLLLWRATLDDSGVVPLLHLSHDDVFDVLKLIVDDIAANKPLVDICAAAVSQVAQISGAAVPRIEVHVGPSITIGNINADHSSVAVGTNINSSVANTDPEPPAAPAETTTGG